ncbi:hypothetical protein J6590_022787 [Homalodisca vitripennis]|nr:hypothetical protein J6590_022787 [Homalodisca vitripennis]
MGQMPCHPYNSVETPLIMVICGSDLPEIKYINYPKATRRSHGPGTPVGAKCLDVGDTLE